MQEAQHKLTNQILCVEQTNRDSFVTVLGDFNKSNLGHDLPKYKMRGEYFGPLLYYYQRCLPRCPTHCTEPLWPRYGPHDPHKQAEITTVLRVFKRWNSEAVEDLHKFLECAE